MPSSSLSFPGIQGIDSFSLTQIRGIVPSTINIAISPQSVLTSKEGTFSITYSSSLSSMSRSFPDCLIDAGSIETDPNGHIVRLKILDRRWKWRFGYIRGDYNIYEADSTTLITATQKTPQELAGLLLDEMGETGYNVSELPNDSFPTVSWSYDNPAEELFALCEMLGCYIVLESDNTIYLHKEADFVDPSLSGVLNTDYGIDTAEIPSAIVVVLGPTKRQARFTLEAIGLDTDGKWKPINQLSYTPASGWGLENYRGFYNVREEFGVEEQKLAKQTVFKSYRIVETVADSGGTKPKVSDPEGEIEDLDFTRERLTPTDTNKLETTVDESGEIVNQPAIIRGIFWDGNADFTNTTSEIPYEGSFSLDRENGYVFFSDPVIRLSGVNFQIDEATLTLEIAVPFRPERYNQHYRATFTLDIGDTGVDGLIVKEDKLEYQVIYNYDASGDFTGTSDNLTELETEITKLLQGELDKLVDRSSFTRGYTGIRDLSPNGAITQVVWNGGKSTPARTDIGVHQEANPRIYHERYRSKDILDSRRNKKNKEKLFKAFDYLAMKRKGIDNA